MQTPSPKLNRLSPALNLLLIVAILAALIIGYVAVIWSGKLHSYEPGQMNENSSSNQLEPDTRQLKSAAQVGTYTFRAYRDESKNDGSFEILLNGKQVDSESCEFCFFYINTGDHKEYPYEDHRYLPMPGEDISGDGIPDLVVERDSGGAHCCCRVSIFSLGAEFKKIADIGEEGAFADYGGENSSYEFKDMDGDHVPEIVGHDWTFAYWWASFAESPAPQFILRYAGGKYVLATDLMARHPPLESEIARRVEALQQPKLWKDGRLPPDLWGVMLDLIYAGKGDAAWAIFDQAWRGSEEVKKEFVKEFNERLSESTLWPEIKAMNQWK